MLTEGVMPDQPVAQIETDLAPCDHTQIGGIIIANGQIEGAGRAQSAINRLDPLPAEIEVVFGLLSIVVAVIEIANVERWIGKDQVQPSSGTLIEPFDGVGANDLVYFIHRPGIVGF